MGYNENDYNIKRKFQLVINMVTQLVNQGIDRSSFNNRHETHFKQSNPPVSVRYDKGGTFDNQVRKI